jgi:hypothetical protein
MAGKERLALGEPDQNGRDQDEDEQGASLRASRAAAF